MPTASCAFSTIHCGMSSRVIPSVGVLPMHVGMVGVSLTLFPRRVCFTHACGDGGGNWGFRFTHACGDGGSITRGEMFYPCMWGWWVVYQLSSKDNSVLPIHVGMVGDRGLGKTSLLGFTHACGDGGTSMKVPFKVLPMHVGMVGLGRVGCRGESRFTHACGDGGVVMSVLPMHAWMVGIKEI
jgi:hypothetical protein